MEKENYIIELRTARGWERSWTFNGVYTKAGAQRRIDRLAVYSRVDFRVTPLPKHTGGTNEI